MNICCLASFSLSEVVIKIRNYKLDAVLLVLCALAPLQVLTILLHEKAALVLFLFFSFSLLLIRLPSSWVVVSKFKFFFLYLVFSAFVAIIGNPTIDVVRYLGGGVLYFILTVVVFFATSHKSKIKFIDYASYISVFAIISIALSQFYSMASGEPFFEIANPNGLKNSWYFLSFSRENLLGLTRPAWIFDEPGTLSYWLTFVAVAREFLGKNRLITLLIVLGGLFTFSLAHLVVVIFFMVHIVFSVFKNRRFGILSFSLILAMLVSIAAFIDGEVVEGFNDTLFFARLDPQEGVLTGNNRSNQVVDYINNVELLGFVFGYPECSLKGGVCNQFPDQSSNIFTPLVKWGVLYSLPFYIIFIYLFCLALSFRLPGSRLLILVLLAVLFQRPYIFEYTYSIVSMMAVYALLVNRPLKNPANSMQMV